MDDEFKIIRCIMDMLKQNPVQEHTLKERLITKRLFKEIKLAQEDYPIFYHIVKQNPSPDFTVALTEETFVMDQSADLFTKNN